MVAIEQTKNRAQAIRYSFFSPIKSMNESEHLEIDRLLSQIADEGASREVVEQLAALLIDRPELQEHYAQAMRLHMMLTHEMSLSSPALKPVIPRQECHYAQELSEECSIPDGLIASLGCDPLLNEARAATRAGACGSWPRRQRYCRWWPLATACGWRAAALACARPHTSSPPTCVQVPIQKAR